MSLPVLLSTVQGSLSVYGVSVTDAFWGFGAHSTSVTPQRLILSNVLHQQQTVPSPDNVQAMWDRLLGTNETLVFDVYQQRDLVHTSQYDDTFWKLFADAVERAKKLPRHLEVTVYCEWEQGSTTWVHDASIFASIVSLVLEHGSSLCIRHDARPRYITETTSVSANYKQLNIPDDYALPPKRWGGRFEIRIHLIAINDPQQRQRFVSYLSSFPVPAVFVTSRKRSQ